MLAEQPLPCKLLQRNVAPWLVEIARARTVRLWAIGIPEDVAQIGRAMATRAIQPGGATERPFRVLHVEAFSTSLGPRPEVVAQLGTIDKTEAVVDKTEAVVDKTGAVTVKVHLRPSRPQCPVDLVALRPTAEGHVTCAEASGAVRPGGRLLSQGPIEDPIGLWPLEESRRLLYKPGPRAEISAIEQAEYINSLVMSHLGLAQALARRFQSRGEPREELEQVSFTALSACAQRFDPTRGVPFGGYAAQSVLGELKRHFRDRTWGAHVARPVQERYLALKEAREALSQSLRRTPNVGEVAAHLKVRDEDIVEAMEAGSSYWPLSLDRPHPQSGEGIDVECPEDAIEHAIDLDSLATAIARLPALERLAIRRYFFEEKTQQAIGTELGVSQMQVSRIITRAVALLRTSFVEG